MEVQSREAEEETASQHTGGEERCYCDEGQEETCVVRQNMRASRETLSIVTGVEREHQGSLQGASGFTVRQHPVHVWIRVGHKV